MTTSPTPSEDPKKQDEPNASLMQANRQSKRFSMIQSSKNSIVRNTSVSSGSGRVPVAVRLIYSSLSELPSLNPTFPAGQTPKTRSRGFIFCFMTALQCLPNCRSICRRS
jgi:hypothetical protein